MKTPPFIHFRLYVAGDGPFSMEAITNLRAICAECLRGSYQIEIVDVLKQKRRALDDGVMITPLLMKLSPEPVSRVVGSLSNRESLLQALGMPARNP